MILIVDNYDSFVWNLARYVRELGGEPVVRRNDALTLAGIERMRPSHVIISPGPCSPGEAGISTAVVRHFGARVPILGVCLGHQCIGAAYGARIARAPRPTHGKSSLVLHTGEGIFAGLPSPFVAARYHSLAIAPETLPAELRVVAYTGSGEIMAVAHRTHPVYGVQFHPESALTEYGYWLLDNFLHGAAARPSEQPDRADLVWAPPRQPGFVPPPVELVR